MNSGPPPAPFGGGPTAPYGRDDRGRGSSGPPGRYGGGGGGDRREMSPGELLFSSDRILSSSHIYITLPASERTLSC